MRARGLMWTGLIGFIVGLAALVVCLLLPVLAGPNISWSEAMLGIIPSGALALVFLVLAMIGMALMLNSKQSRPPRRRRREFDEDDNEAFDDEDDD